MKSLLLALFLILSSFGVKAHPGHGIAVDQQGNIYFSDIGRLKIWRLTPRGGLEAVVENRWAHQLMLDRQGNLVFESEEYVDGKPSYGLWKLESKGELITLIPRTTDREDFPGGVFTIDAAGNLFHPSAGTARLIYRRAPNEPKTVFVGGEHSPFNSIRAMTHSASDTLYVLDSDAVHKIAKDGSVTTIARDLRQQAPSDPPFQHPNPEVANRLYGLAVDTAGVIYIAYHGNRTVLAVQPNGDVSQLYRSSAPWSPTGVAAHDGSVYVRESSFTPELGNGGPRILKVDGEGKVEILVTVGEP